MPEFDLRIFCAVCGTKNEYRFNIPPAPVMSQEELKCEHCGDKTHVLLTSCPSCGQTFKFFLSDLDFMTEIKNLSGAYVKLIEGIRDSISDYIEEFNVPVPKKWSVKLSCTCGHDYFAEIPLRQLRKETTD
ncbi:MAG: hypothetical protein ACTSYL_03055 [Candidatus Thorarchaeota archaeon]